jgi:restriction endonuclease S subunit/predicted nucleotidyltransferase
VRDGLRDEHRQAILDILSSHPGVDKAVLFGSRAMCTFTAESDVDICLYGESLTLTDHAMLAAKMEELPVPQRVDLLLHRAIEDRVLLNHIRREGRVLFERKHLASEWRDTTLGQVTDFLSGGTPSKDALQYWGGTTPWVSAKDMKRFRLDDTEDHVTEDGAANGTKLVPPGTVLLLVRGMTLLNDLPICVVKRPMTFNQDVKALRPKLGVRDEFLPYLLLGHKNRLLGLVDLAGHGTGRLNSDELKALAVVLPPEPEQRAIAHILGTLDDKIELNRRINETLEAIARALFKSWFVDFDPVRAKAEGRDPGLPQPLADLFPDSFEDSELGEIPEGWRVAPLPDVIDVNPPRVLRKGIEAPYLDMANMPTRGHSPNDVTRRTFGSGMRFMNGDTLVARITPCLENGKTAFVDFLEAGKVGWGSTEYIVLRPKAPLPEEFAYCLARAPEFRDFAIQSMTGSSGRQRVPAEALAHFRVVAAPKPIAELFGRLIKPLFERASTASKEGRTLSALRDTLLPKLISGQLRLRDAERLLKENA